MSPSARSQAVVGAVALLGLAMWLVSPHRPNEGEEPRARSDREATAQSVGVDRLRAQPHDPLRTIAASHTVSDSGSTPNDPCRTHTDAEGNTEGDCSVPIALNSPFR